MSNTIVDVALTGDYTIPSASDLTSVEFLFVIALVATLALIVGLLIVWWCMSRMINRVVFGVVYLVTLVAAWILSGVIVSILIFYTKPAP